MAKIAWIVQSVPISREKNANFPIK